MSARPHAFVAMPVGIHPGPDGHPVDFDRIYADFLRPAIEAAGLEAVRAAQAVRGGDDRSDLFQELLFADIVVADISVHDPDVRYELGVCRALRAGGIVLVSGGGASAVFDDGAVQTLRYGTRGGGPDPTTRQADIAALAGMIRETLASGRQRQATRAPAPALLDAREGGEPREPRQVILFSGHRVDEPGRAVPRFPADRVGIAAVRIAEALDGLGAGPQDLALCQAAAGGDLLFLEACQRRGVPCRVFLPFPEPAFIERSILPSTGGSEWRERFHAVKAALADPVLVLPEVLGALPEHADPYEHCNLWLLYTALAYGVDKVRLVALWNGAGGDGPGGTAHLYREVERRTGRVLWIDTRTF